LSRERYIYFDRDRDRETYRKIKGERKRASGRERETYKESKRGERVRE
jgi:hypothetical protein